MHKMDDSLEEGRDLVNPETVALLPEVVVVLQGQRFFIQNLHNVRSVTPGSDKLPL